MEVQRRQNGASKRTKHADDEYRLLEARREVAVHAMRDAEQRQNGCGERQPDGGTEQWRTQPTDWRCRVHQRVNEVGGLPHFGPPFSSLRRFLMARWVATFSAATDLPVAREASLSDISSSFSILIAAR